MSDDSDFSDEDIPLAASRHAARTVAQETVDDGDQSDYRITGALKVPRPTSYTTQALFEQIVANDIDLCPDYQREVVWPEAKQIGIIDSIFRNFYVPPLIFAVVYRDDGSERRVCIDGKQRLTSIFRFMSGEIYHKDVFTKEKFVFKDIGKHKSVKLLPERYVKIFKTKQIVCIEYQDLTNENEREIFQRVQLGMALTPAEKLQAVSSPTASFIRDLQRAYISDGLATELEWDLSRGNDFRCLTHAVYNMTKWPSLGTPSIQTLQKMLQQHEEPDPRFCSQVHQTFQIFLMLAQDSKHKKAFKLSDVKKLAPVEFISIATLIHVHKARLTLAQLSQAIILMRKDVRKKEVDIRMNNRVVKIMVDFIKDLPVLSTDTHDLLPAAKHRPLKRKRVGRDHTDDDEDEGAEVVRPQSKRKAPQNADPPMLTASQAQEVSVWPTAPTELPRSATRSSRQSSSADPDRTAVASPSNPDRLAALKAAKSLSTAEMPLGRSAPSVSVSPQFGAGHDGAPASTLSSHPAMFRSPVMRDDTRPPNPQPPLHPSLPPIPGHLLPRQNSLGESIMARIIGSGPRSGDQYYQDGRRDPRSPVSAAYPPRPYPGRDQYNGWNEPPRVPPENPSPRYYTHGESREYYESPQPPGTYGLPYHS